MTLLSISSLRSALVSSLTAGLLVGGGYGTSALHAQEQDFSKVEIEATDLGDGIHMVSGEGGNLGVSIGEDGVFLIDDQCAPLSENIMMAIGELSNKPISYLLNTHWHFEYTGGNENFGKSVAALSRMTMSASACRPISSSMRFRLTYQPVPTSLYLWSHSPAI